MKRLQPLNYLIEMHSSLVGDLIVTLRAIKCQEPVTREG